MVADKSSVALNLKVNEVLDVFVPSAGEIS
jgi:hypothetical protein